MSKIGLRLVAALIAALACSVVAPTGAGAVSAPSVVTPPSQDPFYTPPPHLGSYRPGTVLRWRQVTLVGAMVPETGAL
jgi:hypothetical protein